MKVVAGLDGVHVVVAVSVGQLLQRERQTGELRDSVLARRQLAVVIAEDPDLADAERVHVEALVVGPGIRGQVVGDIEPERTSLIMVGLKVWIHCVARLVTSESRNTGRFGLMLLLVSPERSMASRPNTRSLSLKLWSTRAKMKFVVDRLVDARARA